MPRKKYVETRYKRQNAFEGQENLLLGLRKRWVEFKNSKLFTKFKHSRLNPYHWGVEKIVADTPGDNKIENNHVYLYDKNGNLVYKNIISLK